MIYISFAASPKMQKVKEKPKTENAKVKIVKNI